VTTAVQEQPRTAARHALAAVGLFRERAWWRSLLLVILFAVTCTFLGRWQWSRHEEKLTFVDRVAANYDSAAVPLPEVLATPTASLAAGDEWRQVSVTGVYLPDRTVLIRNRPRNGLYGYEVIVPLRTAHGADLLVDRGWIPSGRTGARPDSVPASPSGQVQVVVRLRQGEPPSDRTPPPGQAQRINLGQLSSRIGAPVYQAYGVLARESPGVSPAPLPLPKPELDQGPHLAYALQWWIFAMGAFALLGYYAFREAQHRDARARGIDPALLRRRSWLDPEEDDVETGQEPFR
jgi:cytochrome oxidase assembly protein ShyY1